MRTIYFFIAIIFLSIKLEAQITNDENLLDYKKGARIVGYSSNYGSVCDVQYVLANCPLEVSGIPVWCTERNAAFPHFVTVELSNIEWLNIIDFNNVVPDENSGWEGISAKDVEVYVSTTSKDEGFTKVVSFGLELSKAHQIVKINPVKAKWIKFVITSNYGNPEYTEFGQIGVFDDKQGRTSITNELESKGFVDLYGIYFDFGSDAIKPESQSVIEQIAEYLKTNPKVEIQIEGHTDNVGLDKNNQLLSEKRANAVKNELSKREIPANHLTTIGFGSKKPITSNETNIGRAQNRRVTIRKK